MTILPEFFDHAWTTLAGAGMCGAIDSVQYCEIRKSWEGANCPADVSRFIARQVTLFPA